MFSDSYHEQLYTRDSIIISSIITTLDPMNNPVDFFLFYF